MGPKRVSLSQWLMLAISLMVFLFLNDTWITRKAFSGGGMDTPIEAAAPNRYFNIQDDLVFLPLIWGSSVENIRPYMDTSIWNTPISSSPKYDPQSNQMIATIALTRNGVLVSDPAQYSFTVYFVDENTPRWDVKCELLDCTIIASDNTYKRMKTLPNVPIPANAQPSAGSDANMIVIDKETFAEYNFYKVNRTSTGWTVGNGSIYNILWDGMPPKYFSRGAGVPYYAGLIRPWEIAQGKIDHALAFGYSESAKGKCVFPASKSNGDSTLPFAIPQGARLQLDPALTENDFDSWGLDRAGKIIARAMQEYGMFLVEYTGSVKIYVEDLANNPYATQGWSDPELNLTRKTVSKIPYTSFHVLELPPSYWNPEIPGQYHGQCLTFLGFP